MYRPGDTVIYGTDGVCQIDEIVSRPFNGAPRSYYKLRPLFRKDALLLLPVDSERTQAKLRYVLTEEEIYAAIRRMPEATCIWIEPAAARKETYQAILHSGDADQIVRLIKTLYERRQALREGGKKLRVADDAFLKDAERLLYEEFSYVLNIPRIDVPPFIQKELLTLVGGETSG